MAEGAPQGDGLTGGNGAEDSWMELYPIGADDEEAPEPPTENWIGCEAEFD